MNKINIFYGPYEEFKQELPENYVNLTDYVYQTDKKHKDIRIYQNPDSYSTEYEKLDIENLVAFSDNYANLNEHAIQAFASLLIEDNISNLYLQNPPYQIVSQLEKKWGDITEKKTYSYKKITSSFLKNINKQFDKKIIGQPQVRERLLATLYSLTKSKSDKKICVVLFYGPSGVGKTETAKFLSKLMNNKKIFREQMSMYHNDEFSSYLFGGKHSQDSFAKRLLNRKSNVIVLDEFDKCNPIFHSAFYQLFDEGIFKDKNYRVDLTNSIIICTSNYLDVSAIKQNLGEPIYSRFDAIIPFKELSLEDKQTILNNELTSELSKLSKKERKIIDAIELKAQLTQHIHKLENVRKIKNLVRDSINLRIIRKMFPNQNEAHNT